MDKVNLRYSKRVKVITVVISLLVVVLAVVSKDAYMDIFYRALHEPNTIDIILSLLLLSIVAVFLYFIANAPIYYILDEKGLYLKKLVGHKFFSSSDYTIDENTSVNLGGSVRVCGSGGFFGYIGKFYLNKLGMCDFYITNESRDVISIVKKNSGKYTFISRN